MGYGLWVQHTQNSLLITHYSLLITHCSRLRLTEPPHISLAELLDLLLRELLAEGGHVLASLADRLDELRVGLGRLPFGVREIARHELLALGRLPHAVFPVALRAVLHVERRRVAVLREQQHATAGDQSETESRRQPS